MANCELPGIGFAPPQAAFHVMSPVLIASQRSPYVIAPSGASVPLPEPEAGVRLPGHVAASIFYNECREKYDDKDSLPIVSGMKIKVFYLTQKYGRFKSIALPTDTEQVPDWFLDHFTIDREAHILRLVDRPLTNIFKAIKVEVPSKQSLLVGELLEF